MNRSKRFSCSVSRSKRHQRHLIQPLIFFLLLLDVATHRAFVPPDRRHPVAARPELLVTRSWSAVKTGTSKDLRDNWCIGWTDRYIVGVWVGNAGGAPMQRVSGSSGAAPVWRALVDFLHESQPSRPPVPPAGVLREVMFLRIPLSNEAPADKS